MSAIQSDRCGIERTFSQATSNFLTQASWRLYSQDGHHVKKVISVAMDIMVTMVITFFMVLAFFMVITFFVVITFFMVIMVNRTDRTTRTRDRQNRKSQAGQTGQRDLTFKYDFPGK